MRLKLFDRIMLIIILLLVMAACGFLVAVMWNVIPVYLGSLQTFLEYGVNGAIVLQKILISAGLVLGIFLCIRILFIRAERAPVAKPAPGVMVRTSEAGATFVTNAALEGMVQKHVRANPRVRESQCLIIPGRDSIAISLKLSLLPDTNIPEVTGDLQASLKEYIEGMTGITVDDIQIMVETLANPAPVSVPRVV